MKIRYASILSRRFKPIKSSLICSKRLINAFSSSRWWSSTEVYSEMAWHWYGGGVSAGRGQNDGDNFWLSDRRDAPLLDWMSVISVRVGDLSSLAVAS